MFSSPFEVPDSQWSSAGVVKQEGKTLHEAAGTGWWREVRAYLPDWFGNVWAGRGLVGDLGLFG